MSTAVVKFKQEKHIEQSEQKIIGFHRFFPTKNRSLFLILALLYLGLLGGLRLYALPGVNPMKLSMSLKYRHIFAQRGHSTCLN